MNSKKLNKKKIIINGSSSFISKNLSSILEKNYNCIYFNRVTNFNDAALIRKYENKIYAILNLAFVTPKEGNLNKSIIINENIKLTNKIINISKKIKPEYFINFSSMSVYPEFSGKYNEKSSTDCENNKDAFYGISKLVCEKIISISLKPSCKKILHLRISQVQGDYMNATRIIPTMKKELLIKNQITLFGKGKRVSNFISIKYLSEVILFLLKNPKKGILNIGEKNISYLNLAKTLIKKYGNKKSKILFENNDAIVNKFYLNTQKFTNMKK